MESLATSLDKFVDQSLKKFFNEYLRSSTNVLVKNIYSDKDTTFKSLNNLRKNKDDYMTIWAKMTILRK